MFSLRMKPRTIRGLRRLSWKSAVETVTFFHRVTAYDALGPRTFRALVAKPSRAGSDRMYVGERCSIVTCAAPLLASAGTSVTAVAPEPMTTTLLSRSRGPRASAAGG